jgi:hypothetical protein
MVDQSCAPNRAAEADHASRLYERFLPVPEALSVDRGSSDLVLLQDGLIEARSSVSMAR